MRKLASIQRIKNLEPIEGKDRIELATILGWEVIVQKGQFKIDDLCLYIESDSILPERAEFEFLRSRCYSKKWEGFRIKCMKMGGVFSQGIAFPISALNITGFEGQDLTDAIGVKKYDPELLLEREIKDKKQSWIKKLLYKVPLFRKLFYKKLRKPFPTNIIYKTDETRIQVLEDILKEHKDLRCVITEKMDGQSATYFWHRGKFHICSRNFINDDKTSTYGRIGKQIKSKVKKDHVIQGEICGPGIQGNKYRFKELRFFVYNIWNIKTKEYLGHKEIRSYCFENKLEHVPELGFGIGLGFGVTLESSINGLIMLSKGESIYAKIPREGIVIRTIDGKPYNVIGPIFSFKVINPDFIIKYQ